MPSKRWPRADGGRELTAVAAVPAPPERRRHWCRRRWPPALRGAEVSVGRPGMRRGPGEQHRRWWRDGTGREPARARSQHGQGASTGGSGTAWPWGKGATPTAPGHGAARPSATEGCHRRQGRDGAVGQHGTGSVAQAAPSSREGSAVAPSGASCWANTALGAPRARAKLPAPWGSVCYCCRHHGALPAAAACTVGQCPLLVPAPQGQRCCLLPAPRAQCPRHPARTMPAACRAGVPGLSPPASPAPWG